MLEKYEALSQTQKNSFRDISNKLLANTFLARDKRDNKENYYFVVSFKEIFDEFFQLLGYEVICDQSHGVVMIKSDVVSNTLKLKRDETVILLILRLLYHEKLKETSLNENIIIAISDIHEKYNYLELKRRINKTDLVNALRLFRKYNLIETMGDIQVSNSKVVLLPSLLYAVNTEDITEVYNTVNKLLNEEGSLNEKAN